MCPVQFRADGPPHGPPAFMPFETFTRLLDQFPGLREVQLQGMGEPLMHPRFFDMVAFARGRGLRVGINTNLTLLTPARAERCVTSGLSDLSASLDGATAETFEHIRVRARFERVVANLAGLMEAKRRLGGPTPQVRIVAVAMRQNLHELADLVGLAHGLGIGEVFVQHLCHDFGEDGLPDRYLPMREFTRDQTLLGEDLGRIERCFDAAGRAASELGVELRLPSPRPRIHPPGTPGRSRCEWPWTGAYVSYRGEAMPCCMVGTPDRAAWGNMAERGVAAVWDGPAARAFRDALGSDEPPGVCRSCSVYSGTF
jgi:MoaA/NifB/PqqE/SkfB family radical SAM enzyme